MPFKLLSCDGGGIRGLITALLIQDLDKKYGVIAKADGFAGTSTGGLIALALSHGIGIDDIVNIYVNEGGTIFQPNKWLVSEGKQYTLSSSSGLEAERVMAGPGIFSCQYTNSGLIAISTRLFGSGTLSQCGKFIGVNSARLWNNGSWQPTMLANTNGNLYREVTLTDASLATSAAPTYFPPYNVNGFGYFADGGTFANNPTMSAIGEIIDNNLADDISDLKVISLGTGQTPEGINPSAIMKPLDWGADKWMWPMASGALPSMPLLNLALDCTAYVAAIQASQLLRKNYCRANFILQTAVPLDGWKEASQLVGYTKAYMATSQWADVCKWVSDNW